MNSKIIGMAPVGFGTNNAMTSSKSSGLRRARALGKRLGRPTVVSKAADRISAQHKAGMESSLRRSSSHAFGWEPKRGRIGAEAPFRGQETPAEFA
jgi:hypothetical protein